MTPEKHKGDLNELRQEKRRLQIALIATLGLSLILAIGVVRKDTMVVIEPPQRTETISMKGNRVDGAWLRQMGLYVAQMMLDSTPQSIDWQQQEVLRMVHPSTHADLEQRLTVQAKRLIDANATTVFFPSQYAPDVDNQRVVILGRLDTFVNGVMVQGSGRNVAYEASFAYGAGRSWLKDWKEVPIDDPWLARAVEQQAREAEKKAKEKLHAK